MYTVIKRLEKSVTYKFNSLRELHEWAAKNRYAKAREVLVTLNDGSVYTHTNSIYNVFSLTLNDLVKTLD